MSEMLLEIRDLTVTFGSRFGDLTAIENVDMDVRAGEIVGLVGESGAGKSTIGAAVNGLLPGTGRMTAGSVTLGGVRIDTLDDAGMHALRGDRVSMIFQDPQTSLNPLMRIGEQLVETIRRHDDAIGERDARARAVALLGETGIRDAETRIDDYPHQFSGGMRQRVVIALALCTDPELIIADEPTTALDVSIQKQILELVRRLADERGVGIVLITHDIGVIAEISDRVVVLRRGAVVERGDTADVLGNPQAAYTQALMSAVPRLDRRRERFRGIVESIDSDAVDVRVHGAGEAEGPWHVDGASDAFATDWLLGRATLAHAPESATEPEPGVHDPILSLENVSVVFDARRGGPFGIGRREGFRALDDLSFEIAAGSALGLVGESGSGKSTLAKVVTGLLMPAAGTLRFDGETLPFGRDRSRSHPSRRRIQMIFQDPYSSLNERHSVESILVEPLREYGLVDGRVERRRLVASVLDLVGLPQRALLRYPHQFSGGQRQRIAVARALLARPELLIADEPTSALDVSVQAQILNLLKDLQSTFGLSMLFISHDLAVVRQMADRVVVLRRGQRVEYADSERFFTAPASEYGRELLAETPSLALLGESAGA